MQIPEINQFCLDLGVSTQCSFRRRNLRIFLRFLVFRHNHSLVRNPCRSQASVVEGPYVLVLGVPGNIKKPRLPNHTPRSRYGRTGVGEFDLQVGSSINQTLVGKVLL